MPSIGEEVHHVDQHLNFLSGTAKATVNGEEETVTAGDVVIVPAGAKVCIGFSMSAEDTDPH